MRSEVNDRQKGKARSFRGRLAAMGMMAALGGGASVAMASDWSTTNVQLLHGTKYADDFGIDTPEKTVFTFEHANGWKYGDNFFFVDVSNPTTKGTAYYSEFSPRLSFGKIFTGKELSFGPVKDVLLAGTWEMGDGLHAYLGGIGFALNIPKFAFFDLNLYARRSQRDFVAVQTDSGAQVTIDWLLPFEVVGVKFAFEGFADYAWGEKGGSATKADNLITAPRLLVDVGHFWGAGGKLQAGIEYQIWHNKFGIDGVNERVPQVMVKWTM